MVSPRAFAAEVTEVPEALALARAAMFACLSFGHIALKKDDRLF
jgi:hypothetical protein